MASDSDYMAFLNKVNQDPAAAHVSTAATMTSTEFKTMDDDMDVPKPIQKVTTDRFYTSDADEPFVPVCLKWEDNGNELPDEIQFCKLIGYEKSDKAEELVEILDHMTWDPNGNYGDVFAAVEEATGGNPTMVYRIRYQGSSTRVEYWVLSKLDMGKDARLVGVKALSVES